MADQQLKELEAIKVLTDTLGGKVLIKQTRQDVTAAINRIRHAYGKATYEEIVGLCALLDANMSLFEKLTGIDDKIEATKEYLKQSRSESLS